MRKIKFAIASLLGVIAVVMAFALGGRASADTINCTTTSATATSGNTYVLKADSIRSNQSKTMDNNKTTSAATISNTTWGIYSLTGNVKWGFARQDTAYSSYDKHGMYAGGSGRYIDISLAAGQRIDISAIIFSGDTTKADSEAVSGSGSASAMTPSSFSSNWTDLKTFSDTKTYESAGTYRLTFGNKMGFVQISATISSTVTYSLTYDNNGHGDEPAEATEITEVPTLPLLSEDGFKFGGWYYENGILNGEWGEKVTAGDSLSGNTTIYAKWDEAWTITFNSNDPINESSVDSQLVIKGEKVEKPSDPSVSGYEFDGWFTSADGGETLDDEFDFDVAPNSNLTLYAKWNELAKYTLTYENNGHGAVTSPTTDITNIPTLPILEEEGYEFGGWYYDDGIWNETVVSGQSLTSDKTIYAKWSAIPQYAVTYDVDGDTSSSDVYEGTVITLDAAPSKANSIFEGWSDGSTTYAAGTSYTVNSAVTFTATWTTFVAGLGLSFDGSDLYGTYPDSIEQQFVVDGTIFTIYADSNKKMTLDGSNMTLSDGTTVVSGRLKLGGTADFSTPLRVVGFTAPSDGAINVEFVSGSNNNSRTLILKNSSGDEIASASNKSGTNAVKLSADVEAGKTYYFGSGGSGINIGKVSFEKYYAKPLVQKASDATYTYVRFVTIIYSDTEIDASDITGFSVTMVDKDGNNIITNDYTPYVVKKITNNGDTYTSKVKGVDHDFDNKVNSNEYYVVFVLRFTTANFAASGKYEYNGLYSTTTYGGKEYNSPTLYIVPAPEL